MALVFQYGSNASSERLNSSCRLGGAACAVGLVFTEDRFDLAFTHYSRTNECGTADLVPNGSRQIYGVLYEIPENRLFRSRRNGARTLDEIEGEYCDYRRTQVCVIDAAPPHESRAAITYVVKAPSASVKTSAPWVSHIIKGLREHGAPDEYVDYVKKCATENNPDLDDLLDEL